MNGNGEQTTHFGYREVPVSEKTGLVHQVFESVADNYDLMVDDQLLNVSTLTGDGEVFRIVQFQLNRRPLLRAFQCLEMHVL